MLSPNGICKPFDEQADGYNCQTFPRSHIDRDTRFSRGEGAVVVVVKSLQNALLDNDHIYCTVGYI